MALAMFWMAICKKPSATDSAVAALRAGCPHLLGQRFELRGHALAVQRFVASGPEDLREKRRLDPAQQHVRVGGGQRPAAAVACRARVGARAVGPDAQARAVEVQHRATAGRHGVDAHHRRAHAHAGHLGLERPLELARVVAHVGGGAAHVEADDARVPCRYRRAHHADDAAGRAREDGVLALEVVRLGEARRCFA